MRCSEVHYNVMVVLSNIIVMYVIVANIIIKKKQ